MDTLYHNDLWRRNKLAKDDAHGTNTGFDHGAAWSEQIRNLAI